MLSRVIEMASGYEYETEPPPSVQPGFYTPDRDFDRQLEEQIRRVQDAFRKHDLGARKRPF